MTMSGKEKTTKVFLKNEKLKISSADTARP